MLDTVIEAKRALEQDRVPEPHTIELTPTEIEALDAELNLENYRSWAKGVEQATAMGVRATPPPADIKVTAGGAIFGMFIREKRE